MVPGFDGGLGGWMSMRQKSYRQGFLIRENRAIPCCRKQAQPVLLRLSGNTQLHHLTIIQNAGPFIQLKLAQY
jgi:hypothetical protein